MMRLANLTLTLTLTLTLSLTLSLTLALTLDQVKRMMRLANLTPTTAIAKDAVFLVSKSAETFLQV